jgi:hypothetical protein
VRAELNEEELEIAMGSLECQEKSYTNQFTAEEVATALNKRNIKMIEDILDGFVHRGILSKTQHKADFFYHARSPIRYE